MKKFNIAIDGPSASGKSTIAKALATKLNFVHLDTGAMYRCVALKALHNSIAWDNEEAVLEMLKNTKIVLTSNGDIYLDDENVSKEIRAEEISMGASDVSKHAKIRAELVKRQQLLAKDKGFILDGRDIGSVVLTDAEIKIFQTASVEMRSLRRYLENKEKGIACDFENIQAEIAKRDYQDTHRAASPLIKVEGAYELDTSNLSIDEAIEEVIKYISATIK